MHCFHFCVFMAYWQVDHYYCVATWHRDIHFQDLATLSDLTTNTRREEDSADCRVRPNDCRVRPKAVTYACIGWQWPFYTVTTVLLVVQGHCQTTCLRTYARNVYWAFTPAACSMHSAAVAIRTYLPKCCTSQPLYCHDSERQSSIQ